MARFDAKRRTQFREPDQNPTAIRLDAFEIAAPAEIADRLHAEVYVTQVEVAVR